jgi:hypothetical protein
MTKEKPATDMVENVDASADEVVGFKDAHQAAVAAALVPVGGVYLTPEEMKMVRSFVMSRNDMTTHKLGLKSKTLS